MVSNIKTLKNNIPKPVRLFLGKALLVFIIWEVIYGMFLYDSQIIDRVLTKHVGESSAFVLNNLGDMSGFTAKTERWDSVYSGEKLENQVSAIYHDEKKVLYIANACNGLSLLVLYIGFIICMPSKFWRKLKYIVLGVVILDVINILRCVGLIYLQEYYNAYFDFAHHYLFKATVYASTFVIWMLYARKISLKNEII